MKEFIVIKWLLWLLRYQQQTNFSTFWLNHFVLPWESFCVKSGKSPLAPQNKNFEKYVCDIFYSYIMTIWKSLNGGLIRVKFPPPLSAHYRTVTCKFWDIDTSFLFYVCTCSIILFLCQTYFIFMSYIAFFYFMSVHAPLFYFYVKLISFSCHTSPFFNFMYRHKYICIYVWFYDLYIYNIYVIRV